MLAVAGASGSGKTTLAAELARTLGGLHFSLDTYYRDLSHLPMAERALAAAPELEVTITSGTPMGRMAEAREVAEAVVWLCSDRASFVTGLLMAVDGGMTAQ